jgi:hypothetical protein
MDITREEVEDQYELTLTDNQWSILLEEVAGREDDEEIWDVIDNTIADLEFLEAEYAWWAEQVKKAQANI